MELILSRFRNLTILLVVILAQLVLLAYQVKSNQDVRLIRVWSVTAVTPVAKVLEIVRRYTIGLVEDYIVLVNVREQNRQLLASVGTLKMENQFLRTELSTADRVRALSAFQAHIPSRSLPARIIGSGTGANSRVVFVDRGSSSGIMKGMAVVTPDGIVGKVLAAYPTASQVLLITDPTFAAGVISQKNRVPGTLKGLGQSKCLIDYVQNEEKVEPGEEFFTSGDDRVFPKGMSVGKVSVVRPGPTFKEIYLIPSGSQNGLEEVLIVLEGVHQAIPEAQSTPSQDIYIGPAAPKIESKSPPGTTQTEPPVLGTTADRILDRYKSIGEAQHHVYGQGFTGSKPPDFNLDPSAKPPAPKPVTPSPPVEGTPTQAASPVQKPATPAPVVERTAPAAPPKPKPRIPQDASATQAPSKP